MSLDTETRDALRAWIASAGAEAKAYMQQAGDENALISAKKFFDETAKKVRATHPEIEYDPALREQAAMRAGVRAGALTALFVMKSFVDKALGLELEAGEW